MKAWLSKIAVPHVGVFLQGIMVSILGLSGVIAWSSWQAEAGKRQTDATLRYFTKCEIEFTSKRLASNGTRRSKPDLGLDLMPATVAWLRLMFSAHWKA